MTWSNVALQLTQALIPIIALALTALLSLAADYLRQKAVGVRQEVARQSLWAAISEAERVGVDAIAATQQVFVADVKAAAEDGKLTAEEARGAMAHAMEYFCGHIAPGTLEILEAAYGPVDEWLRGYLEARLAEHKGGTVSIVGELAHPI